MMPFDGTVDYADMMARLNKVGYTGALTLEITKYGEYLEKSDEEFLSVAYERIRKIAEHIFEHHEQHVHPQGKDIYTALFAVDSIKTLGKYYDVFKELNAQREEKDR